MQADPTVVYATDTMALDDLRLNRWPEYLFWDTLGVADLATVDVSQRLQSHQTYQNPGLPDWPIASPDAEVDRGRARPRQAQEPALLLRLPRLGHAHVRAHAPASTPATSPSASRADGDTAGRRRAGGRHRPIARSGPSSADLGRWRRRRPGGPAAAPGAPPEQPRRGSGSTPTSGCGARTPATSPGFVLGEGEEKVAGPRAASSCPRTRPSSLADSRYRVQALRGVPGQPRRGRRRRPRGAWPELLARPARRRPRRTGACAGSGVEAGFLSHATWTAFAAATPGRGAGARRGPGSRPLAPSRSPPSWSASAPPAPSRTRPCAPRCRDIRPGVTEHELALALEWGMRTGGAEALAFDVACLAGPRAALPHGSPGDRAVARRRGAAVRLRGAGVAATART